MAIYKRTLIGVVKTTSRGTMESAQSGPREFSSSLFFVSLLLLQDTCFDLVMRSNNNNELYFLLNLLNQS